MQQGRLLHNSHGHTTGQMHEHMAVESPHAWIVSNPANDGMAHHRHNDRVAFHGALEVKLLLNFGLIAIAWHFHLSGMKHPKLVAMQVERMRPIVQVYNDKIIDDRFARMCAYH
mgnify:CR=1 FL=1